MTTSDRLECGCVWNTTVPDELRRAHEVEHSRKIRAAIVAAAEARRRREALVDPGYISMCDKGME
jgi:hypothetical protein